MEASAGVEEVHILWISEGMSCDGDSQLPEIQRYLKIRSM